MVSKAVSTISLFAYAISDNLFLTGGIRYAHDTVTDAYYNLGTDQVFVPDQSSDSFTPRVVLRYKPNPESSIYASYSRG